MISLPEICFYDLKTSESSSCIFQTASYNELPNYQNVTGIFGDEPNRYELIKTLLNV